MVAKRKYPNICKAIKAADPPIEMKIGSKTYFFRPYAFGELGPEPSYGVIREIVDGTVKSLGEFPNYDYLVTTMPGGSQYSEALSKKTNKSVINIGNEKLFARNVASVPRNMSYRNDFLFFNLDDYKRGDEVVIFEDVISSTGTIQAILTIFESIRVDTVGIQSILAKGDNYRKLEEKYDIPIRSLVRTAENGITILEEMWGPSPLKRSVSV